MDDVESAAWTLCDITSQDAYRKYGRGAETALPMRSIGVCDRCMLHVARMRYHGERRVHERSCGALWVMAHYVAVSHMEATRHRACGAYFSGFKFARLHEIELYY